MDWKLLSIFNILSKVLHKVLNRCNFKMQLQNTKVSPVIYGLWNQFFMKLLKTIQQSESTSPVGTTQVKNIIYAL